MVTSACRDTPSMSSSLVIVPSSLFSPNPFAAEKPRFSGRNATCREGEWVGEVGGGGGVQMVRLMGLANWQRGWLAGPERG